MGTQAGATAGQQERCAAAVIAFGQRDRDRRAFQRRRRIDGCEARERRAELCDIPPGGIVKCTDH